MPERKAGHSTAYPLSASVGEAIIDYLRHGRPQTTSRYVFFRAVAPVEPIGPAAVSARARHYLLQGWRSGSAAGVAHAQAHVRATPRRRRFLAEDDRRFVGHRSAKSTEIYAKVAVESLREVALGDGEEVLA